MKSLFALPAVFRCAGFFLLLSAGIAGQATAANILYTAEGAPDGVTSSTIGVEFTPTENISVTHLGVFSGGSDGPDLQTSHAVGLWNVTNPSTPLVTITVDNSAFLQHGFRFASITPVVLTAGQTYVLAAYYTLSGDKQFFNANWPTSFINPYPLVAMSVVPRAAFGSPGLAFPSPVTQWTNELRITANMLFTPSDPSLIGDGDINNDTRVDAADVALAARLVLGSLDQGTNPYKVVRGDIAPYISGASQPDNVIDVNDMLLIIRIALGTFTL